MPDCVIGGGFSLYVLLASIGKTRAGPFRGPVTRLAKLPLLIKASSSCPTACSGVRPARAGLHRARLSRRTAPLAGATLRAGVLGFGGWPRGDSIVPLPFRNRGARRELADSAPGYELPRQSPGEKGSRRLHRSGSPLPALLLGLFYPHVYDEFHPYLSGAATWSREALSAQDNPGASKRRGLTPRRRGPAPVQQHGLTLRHLQGRLLRDEALDHEEERPGWPGRAYA